MAKARSPAYPSISLGEAIEKITDVYNHDYQNPIPKAVVAGHMGYGGLNGKSLGVISSLSKFGLLEGRGDQSRVSDLAVQIIAHPPASPERVQALRTASGEPSLFAELDKRFQGGRASDQAIRSFLLTQRFIPHGADAAIRSYRETKNFVEAEAAGHGVEMASEGTTASFNAVVRSAGSAPEPERSLSGKSAGEEQVNRGDGGFFGLEGEAYRIQLRPKGIDVVAKLEDVEGVDRLIRALEAVKFLIGGGEGTRPNLPMVRKEEE